MIQKLQTTVQTKRHLRCLVLLWRAHGAAAGAATGHEAGEHNHAGDQNLLKIPFKILMEDKC